MSAVAMAAISRLGRRAGSPPPALQTTNFDAAIIAPGQPSARYAEDASKVSAGNQKAGTAGETAPINLDEIERRLRDDRPDLYASLNDNPLPTFRDYLAGWVESRVFVFFAGAYVGVFLTLVSAVVAS
jgi:hypothetical protein